VHNSSMPTPAIYCADIGANYDKAKKFGWWSNRETRSVDDLEPKVESKRYRSLSKLAAAVTGELRAGQPVALGFECRRPGSCRWPGCCGTSVEGSIHSASAQK
jgi:hypothetical protein